MPATLHRRLLRKLPPAAASLLALIVALGAAPQPAEAFIKTGIKPFIVVGGSATTKQDITRLEDTQSEESDLDDASNLGLTLYGLITVLPPVEAGLALHYLPSLELKDKEENVEDIGTETDANLMVNVSLPTPLVETDIRGEGGLTFFSASEDVKDGFQDFDDETSPLGWNVGAGVSATYSILPLVGISLGLDYQYYSFEIFSGTNEEPGIGTSEAQFDISGSRFKLSLGLQLSL